MPAQNLYRAFAHLRSAMGPDDGAIVFGSPIHWMSDQRQPWSKALRTAQHAELSPNDLAADDGAARSSSRRGRRAWNRRFRVSAWLPVRNRVSEPAQPPRGRPVARPRPGESSGLDEAACLSIRVVSRDRGGEYAAAVAKGAPQAVEVADRFHVVKNLSEAVGPLIARCQAEILATIPPEDSHPLDPEKPTLSIAEWRRDPTGTCRARATGSPRRAAGPLSSLVVELHEQGMTAKAIARRFQLSDRTVHRWLAAGSFH